MKAIISKCMMRIFQQTLLMIFVFPALAQQVSEEWATSYSGALGTAEYVARGIVVDKEKNSYVLGLKSNRRDEMAVPIVIKFAPNGDEVWSRVYGLEQRFYFGFAAGIVIDSQDRVFITGSDGRGDFLTVRINLLDGTPLWEKYYDGGGNETPLDIAVDNLGSVYVTGYGRGPNGGQDYTTIRYDAVDGEQYWVSHYDGGLDDLAVGISVNNQGGVFVTGYNTKIVGGFDQYDYVTIGYSAVDGHQIWKATYSNEGNRTDNIGGIAANDAGVYLTWTINSATGTDILTVRYDALNGNQVWASTFGNTEYSDIIYEEAHNIAIDNNGGIYVTGLVQDNFGSNKSYITLRLSAQDGTLSWSKLYEGRLVGGGSSYRVSLAVDNIGGVYITGASNNKTCCINDYDYTTIRYDTSSGNELWVKHHDSNEDNVAHNLAIDYSGGVYVVGRGNGSPVRIVKYQQCFEITDKDITGASIAPVSSMNFNYSVIGTGAIIYTWNVTDSDNVPYTNFSGQGSNSIAINWPSSPNLYKINVTYSGGESCVPRSSLMYVAIYDPSGGFVTGGGWISSPPGAYKLDESKCGRANFGFVSKYQKGAKVPSGDTNFEFTAADFHFKSTSYEWLVVTGATARYKGEGTINGSGNYGFILSAVDGQVTGGGDYDKFRIKIWDKNNNDVVVYDNNLSSTGDDALAETIISGGSIVVHEAKKTSSSKSIVAATEPQGANFYSYPTAFSTKTTIAFTLDKAGEYLLEVFDMKGALVKKLAAGSAEANKLYEIELDGTGMREGLYITRLTTSSNVRSLKTVLKR